VAITDITGIVRDQHQILIRTKPWFSGHHDARFKLTVDGTDRIVVDNRDKPRTTIKGDLHLTGDLVVKGLDGTDRVVVDVRDHRRTTMTGDFHLTGDLVAKGIVNSPAGTELAQRYAADAGYPPGTVVIFGGGQEITASTTAQDSRVAGIVSTVPAFMMGDKAGTDQSHPYVALKGRVPCRVAGPVAKGDLLTTSTVPGAAQRATVHQTGTILGKALQDLAAGEVRIIEVFAALM
jgi:hypothetical protein